MTDYQYASDEPIANIDIDGLESGSAVTHFSYDYVSDSRLFLPTFAPTIGKAAETGLNKGLNIASIALNTARVGFDAFNNKGGAPNTNSNGNIRTTGDNASPWQVGKEWLTGKGPREHNFSNGDPFTEMLKKHEHIQETRKIIGRRIATNNGKLEDDNDYDLGGLQGVPKYVKDYSTLITFGQTGNLAVTYLGSYKLHFRVVSINVKNRTALIKFKVSNNSTISSATHPPVIGYTKWWNKYIGKPMDNFFSIGPLSKTTQTFEWTESIKW